jgi:TatD DNase family protein
VNEQLGQHGKRLHWQAGYGVVGFGTGDMTYFDTHSHLDAGDFDADRAEVIARANAAGVLGIACIGASLASSEKCLKIAETSPGIVAAVGIHPNSTAEAAPDDWDRIVALAEHPRVVALGETGLDRYWDYAPIALQQDYLERHLRLGRRRGLPIILHCRDAAADLLPMLRKAAKNGPLSGILHAMSGDADWAAECVALGLYISFAGNVTYTNKKFEPLRAAAQSVPDDRLLIETDSPYLTPQAFRGKRTRNEPAHVVHTAALLAKLRGVQVERFAALTTANARRVFRLPHT